MSVRGRYLSGLAFAAIMGAFVIVAASPGDRIELAFGVVSGVLVQAPLGWVTVRSLGTERLQIIWVVGMLVRLAMIAVTGLILVPLFGWALVPALGSLVLTILVLLVLEVLTVMRESSGIKAR